MNKLLLSLAALALSASASAQSSESAEPVALDLTLSLSRPTDPDSEGCLSAASKQLDSFFFVCEEKGLVAASGTTKNATIRSEEGDFEASAHLRRTGGLNQNYSYFSAAFGKEPQYNGKYIITIDKEAFGDSIWLKDPAFGHTNAPLELTFTLIDGVRRSTTALRPLSITPAEGTYESGEDIASITVTFGEDVEMVSGAKAYLGGFNSSYDAEASFTPDGGGSFTAVFSEAPSEDANYRLTIPRGAFTDAAGNINDRIELLYTIDKESGISGLEISQDSPAIFNLQGVKVSSGSLPSGIYVVNGKKVVVK